MATNRSSVNLIYQNALLSAFVSCKNGVSQSFILKTMGANRYFLRKAIVRRIYVGRLGRTFGRIPQKRPCDVLNEQDSNLVKKWWDIASTISPNTKDVKRR